jgi:hypothetical protein
MAYHIIVLAGQSNAVGQGTGDFTDPFYTEDRDAKIKQVGRLPGSNKRVIDIGNTDNGIKWDGLQHWRKRLTDFTMGFGLPFSRRYVAQGYLPEGDLVLIIPAAFGGTSILQWTDNFIPLGETQNIHDDMVSRINVGLATQGSEIKAILWAQGETDMISASTNEEGMSSVFYKQKLKQYVHMLRRDVSTTAPIVMTLPLPSWTPGCLDAKWAMENAIKSVAHSTGCAVASTSIPTDLQPNLASNPHINAASQIELAQRYFAKWLVLTGM